VLKAIAIAVALTGPGAIKQSRQVLMPAGVYIATAVDLTSCLSRQHLMLAIQTAPDPEEDLQGITIGSIEHVSRFPGSDGHQHCKLDSS